MTTVPGGQQVVAAAGLPVGTVTYGYNANGEQTINGTITVTYNAARQTRSITEPGKGTTTYTYDGNGNRVAATNGTTIKRYVWDTLGGLPNLVLERDGTNTLIRRYVYGPDRVISTDTPTATSYYLTDTLGSVTNLVGPTGTVQATYTYDPWGAARTTTVADPTVNNNPLKYTGQYLDATSNYHLRARQCNPTLGLFTQTDPLAHEVGSPYPSAYVYANSSPLKFVDPSGRRSVGAHSDLDSAGVPTILAFARTGLSCSTGGGSPYQDDAGVPIPNSGATKCGSWGHRVSTFRGDGRPDIDLARMGKKLRNLLRKSGWKPRVFGGCIDGQVDFVNLQLSAQGCWGRTSAGTFGAATVTVPTTAAAGISAIGSAGVFATNAHHARDLNGWGVCVSVVAGDGLGGVGVGCGSLGWVTHFEKGSSHRKYEDFEFTGTYFAYIGVGVGGRLSGGASLTWTTTFTLGWS